MPSAIDSTKQRRCMECVWNDSVMTKREKNGQRQQENEREIDEEKNGAKKDDDGEK